MLCHFVGSGSRFDGLRENRCGSFLPTPGDRQSNSALCREGTHRWLSDRV